MKLPPQSGLYIHFPFCQRRCHYCDFNTYAVPDIPTEAYTKAILAELRHRAPLLDGTRLQTVFLGGGTPGLWGPRWVGRVLQEVETLFPDAAISEITIEVNPGECDQDMLRAYREEAGCTRVSFGVQALDDVLLRSMDRIHSADEARAAMRAAAAVGFDSWSIDLIFGLPGQTPERWQRDLEEALSFQPPHISIYNLMVEASTPLYLMVRDKKVTLPSDEIQLEMLALATERAEHHGLTRYEISNFSQSNHTSQHNLLYWTGRPYLGLGAGAHSFLPESDESEAIGRREMNIKKYSDYMRATEESGHAVASEETIDPITHLRERMMTGLRLDAGVDLNEVQSITGLDPERIYEEVLTSLRDEALVEWNERQVRLTPQAIAVSDAVFLRFF